MMKLESRNHKMLLQMKKKSLNDSEIERIESSCWRFPGQASLNDSFSEGSNNANVR